MSDSIKTEAQTVDPRQMIEQCKSILRLEAQFIWVRIIQKLMDGMCVRKSWHLGAFNTFVLNSTILGWRGKTD